MSSNTLVNNALNLSLMTVAVMGLSAAILQSTSEHLLTAKSGLHGFTEVFTFSQTTPTQPEGNINVGSSLSVESFKALFPVQYPGFLANQDEKQLTWISQSEPCEEYQLGNHFSGEDNLYHCLVKQ